MSQTRRERRAAAREAAKTLVGRQSGARLDLLIAVFGIGLAIVLYLWHPGPGTIILACVLVLASWGYVAWHLPWVNRSGLRRGTILALLGAGVALFGARVWATTIAPSPPSAVHIDSEEVGLVGTPVGPKIVANIYFVNDADDADIVSCGAAERTPLTVDPSVQRAIAKAVLARAAREKGPPACMGPNNIGRNEKQWRTIYDAEPLSAANIKAWLDHKFIFVFGAIMTLKNRNGIVVKRVCGISTGITGVIHACPEVDSP